MKINKELIEKCIKFNESLYLKDIIFFYSKYKKNLKTSDNYLSFITNLSYCYIMVYSLYNNTLKINKVIADEFSENLDNYLEKTKDESGSWELDDETIQRKIEWILNNSNKY